MALGDTAYDLLTKILAALTGGITTTPPANQSVNNAQIAGTAVATGTGASSAGTQRVVLATDSALAANQSVNVAQMGGSAVATAAGTGNSTTVQRVVLAIGSTPTLVSFAFGTFAASQTFLAAGTTRVGVIVANDSDVIIYIRFGTVAATTAAYSVKIAAGTVYHVPREFAGSEMRGIGASAGTAGSVQITSII